MLKPSEKSPLTAIKVAELAVEAGIPPGVLNVVPGLGQTAGKALALHTDVDCIAFTGSTATGKQIMQYAGQSNLKRLSLECGGKSPNIVMADYPDLDRAAKAAAFAIFFNQGEMCSAGSRLLVQESIKDALLEKVQAVSRKMQPGDPLDPATRLGAIVDETQMKRVLGYIDSGRNDGAELRFGGRRVREDSGGYFIEPTVFEAVKPNMTIAREEIFGPVLSAITFKTIEEAIEIANDVIYGLAAAVWTRLLDVPAALAARTYAAEGRLGLAVHDEFRPHQAADGTVTLEGGPDGATVKPGGDADLACGVSALSAAWLGGVRWTTLARAGLVEERRAGALAHADALFASDPLPYPFTWF